jgi:amidase
MLVKIPSLGYKYRPQINPLMIWDIVLYRDSERSPQMVKQNKAELSRRQFLELTSATAAASILLGAGSTASADELPDDLIEATFVQLQAAMASNRLTAEALVRKYIERIEDLDRGGPRINSVIQLNPDALRIARSLDLERRVQGSRGPLHGIPILLKDTIDTGDRMMTTAGSLALVGPPAARDATGAAKLRAAGVVILGKTNPSEWASHRSFRATSGWSAVGGQTKNPYVLDRNPSGSSSGSAAATSANLCAAAIGTETDLSIVSPSSANGIVGIKPTTGLTSRAGVVAGSHTHDTVGPLARTVTDAATLLGVLTGIDPLDPATSASAGKFFKNYTQFLDADGLGGARIGVLRRTFSGFSQETDAVFNQAIQIMKDAGAVIFDPADLPTAQAIATDRSEGIVHAFEFKADIVPYLASRPGLSVHNLADLISFNIAHADQELVFFGQELFFIAQSTTNLNDPVYLNARQTCLSLSQEQGIDAALTEFGLDALICPTGSPAWSTDLLNGDHLISPFPTPAGMAGYPTVSVPGGFSFGLPVGVSFIGTAYSEPVLIKLAFAFEQAANARKPPQFIRSLALG